MVKVYSQQLGSSDGFILPVAERGQAGAGQEAETVRDGGHGRPAAAAGQE